MAGGAVPWQDGAFLSSRLKALRIIKAEVVADVPLRVVAEVVKEALVELLAVAGGRVQRLLPDDAVLHLLVFLIENYVVDRVVLC